MQVPDTSAVNSWVTFLTPIAVAILIVVQKWDTNKARADSAIHAESIRINYQRLLESHNRLAQNQLSQADMISEMYGIFKKGKITVEPPPPPPPPPPVPVETPLDKKKKSLFDSLLVLLEEMSAAEKERK